MTDTDTVRLFSWNTPEKGCILALGTFDGVHKGHRRLLNKALEMGRKLNLSTGVFFFTYPPARYFSDVFPGVLTTPEEREKLFESYGADFSVGADFTVYRDMSPDSFIDRLISRYSCRGVVCGENFTFGRNCSGTFSLLRERFGDNFLSVSLCLQDGEPVSSSAVRKYLSEGLIEKASAMLGRNFTVRGTVVHGREDGRKIGFPTANIIPDGKKILPGRGVYLTKTVSDGESFTSLTDIGFAPTLTSSEVYTTETHIPGFTGNLYGKEIEISFLRKIRDEMTFSSVDELKIQLKKDVDSVIGTI